ncbi:hypothetical protein D210916BOD24_29940 [Alteromonas sp. D210916BOD_24]
MACACSMNVHYAGGSTRFLNFLYGTVFAALIAGLSVSMGHLIAGAVAKFYVDWIAVFVESVNGLNNVALVDKDSGFVYRIYHCLYNRYIH